MAGPTESDVRVRRSKIQRQEGRRERQAKARRVGGPKKDKPTADEGYIVVRQSDAAATKYLTPLDPEQVRGVALDHARATAAPVECQEADGIAYAPVRVGAWRLAVEADETVTAAQAEELYEKTGAGEEN